MENKILVDNFYERNLVISLTHEIQSKQISENIITGIHPAVDDKEVRRQIISEIFKTLLLHDKIVLPTTNIYKLVFAFGIEDAILLIKSNKFEFIDDLGLTVVMGEMPNDKYNLSYIYYASKTGLVKNSVEWLERKLHNTKKYDTDLINVLLINTEKQNTDIDTKSIIDKILKETKYDLLNSNITNFLNYSSPTIEEVKRVDVYNLLRLTKLNQSLIYSSELNIKNVALDGVIKPIMGAKLSPLLNKTFSANLYDVFFNEILQKKDIPDLSDLYMNGIITIHDYLELLSTLSSNRFRQWINSSNYDIATLEKDILSSNKKITNKYIKFIRWTVPNAIGLLLPAVGISTSFVDSYIIGKLMSGWHPNFFMDDILKKLIDKKIESHNKIEREMSIKKRFPKTGRNDSCPCGSNKKFKNCCGK